MYNYKYNGKELQDELGLNLYDYSALQSVPKERLALRMSLTSQP